MNVCIKSAELSGTVKAVASKSDAHRALICAALGSKPCQIEISSTSVDIEATATLLAELGAGISKNGTVYTVVPLDKNAVKGKTCTLNCHESGSTLRFMLPVAAALGANATFVGEGRLPQRPMHDMVQQLCANGCNVQAKDGGFLPISVSAGLKNGSFVLPGNVSSQYITGLLFALPLLPDGGKIELTTNLESASYVDLTLQVLAQFGVSCKKAPDYRSFVYDSFVPYVSPDTYTVEGDWSQAAFWLSAGFLGADVTVTGLKDESSQGDKAVKQILAQFAGTENVEVDARNIPDLIPVLAIAACGRNARTTFANCGRLRLKESDRIESTCKMIESLGGKTASTQDTLTVFGSGKLCGGTVDGMNDHRIVMASAVASVLCTQNVTILGAQAINKSYPAFFTDFAALKGDFDVIDIRE